MAVPDSSRAERFPEAELSPELVSGPAQAQPMNTAWQGEAHLTYRLQGDKTVPLVQTRAPLKVQRPFYPEGDRWCHTILLHTAGGMVGGDQLSYHLALAPQTQALVTTAAAAKIYNDQPHQRPALVSGQVQVAPGATLEWLPQEAIVFEGARYHQRWRIEVAPGGHWLGWDVMRLGRTARGERFVRGEVRSHLEVWQEGQLLWLDPQHLQGGEVQWHSPHALGSCPVVGTLGWIGTTVNLELVTELRRLGLHATQGQGDLGVSRLQRGVVCRYRGHSTSAVRRWFEAVRGALRLAHHGAGAIAPRVWQR